LLQLSDYDVYIFDCDGVILDSNQLKIKAMREALYECLGKHEKIDECIEYFKRNFGTSRFNHINVFVSDILGLPVSERKKNYNRLLCCYSTQCKKLYLKAELTPGVLEFIQGLAGKKYIASGSEQNELIEVFKRRGLDMHFEKILGSPEAKVNLVSNILKDMRCNAVMFGDAISDMKAAIDNSIDFIAYLPYSNVRDELVLESEIRGFTTIDSWSFNK
jgi:phosphoglycolate phosphatase-like HAD superfamily hydrolase